MGTQQTRASTRTRRRKEQNAGRRPGRRKHNKVFTSRVWTRTLVVESTGLQHCHRQGPGTGVTSFRGSSAGARENLERKIGTQAIQTALSSVLVCGNTRRIVMGNATTDACGRAAAAAAHRGGRRGPRGNRAQPAPRKPGEMLLEPKLDAKG